MEPNEFSSGYQDYLQRELADRKAGNPAYSLRAFARDLGVSPATLSQALSHKRQVSAKNALKIASRLLLSPEEAARLFADHGKAGRTKVKPQFFELEEDRFRLVADWYYFAILSLARVPNNKAAPEWVSKRLGISLFEARAALTRLKRMRLISTKDGRLRRTATSLMTGHATPSEALRKHQKQNLKLAERAIDRVPLALRENSSVTMAIDPRRIGEAKRRILEFKKSLSNYMEKGELGEVYTLAVHLFPAFNGRNES